MLAALKLRSVLGDLHPLRYLAATFVAPLLLGQVGRDKKWIKSHYDVDPQFFVSGWTPSCAPTRTATSTTTANRSRPA